MKRTRIEIIDGEKGYGVEVSYPNAPSKFAYFTTLEEAFDHARQAFPKPTEHTPCAHPSRYRISSMAGAVLWGCRECGVSFTTG